MQVKCIFELGETGAVQNSPIIYNGVIYINGRTKTYAIDGRTCHKIWDHEYTLQNIDGAIAAARGVALYDGKVFRGTADGHLIALDAATGKLLWDTTVHDSRAGYSISAAVLAYQGKVFRRRGRRRQGHQGPRLGVRRQHRQARLGVRPDPQRAAVRGRHLGRRPGPGRRRRVGGRVDRPPAQPGDLPLGQSRSGLRRQRARGRQPVQRLHRRPEHRRRQAGLVRPAGPARHPRQRHRGGGGPVREGRQGLRRRGPEGRLRLHLRPGQP
ncbi:MAG: PQQ-binding-like beta-propeller repeat protein [Caulobacteraceae bacterium]